MTTIFETSSISIQNVSFFTNVELTTTERTQESGALAACFFLAFTLGAFSALLSKVSVVSSHVIAIVIEIPRFIILFRCP